MWFLSSRAMLRCVPRWQPCPEQNRARLLTRPQPSRPLSPVDALFSGQVYSAATNRSARALSPVRDAIFLSPGDGAYEDSGRRVSADDRGVPRLNSSLRGSRALL